MMLQVYFAQKAFIVHGGCLLAVRRDPSDPNQPCRWEVPGGRLEAGEELDQHLIREVYEEVGILVTPGRPFYVWKWDIKQEATHAPAAIVAAARICSAQNSEISIDGRVEGDHLDLAEWIPLPRLRDYDWIPNMLPVLDAFLTQIKARSDAEACDQQ